MTAVLTPAPKAQFLTNNGEPLVGGKLYSYAAGTTTPLATYTTYAGTIANTNPVILDSRGEANVWLTSGVLYKLALYDADNALIWTVDNVSSRDDGIFTGPVAGTTATFSGALTAASGAFSGAVSGTTGTFSGNVQMASANGGQLAGLRNRVINGDMRIDQRQNGGSITITSAGVYTVDRSFSSATGANLTGNRTTTGTSSFGCTRSTQFIGAASNTGAQLGQRIEAANLQDFETGTTITISCYIYSSAAFTPTWQWITATTTDTTYSTVGASGSFAAVPATTWTRVTATFTAPANTTNGAQVTIQLGATLAGVTKAITGLQVEVGPVATPFEQRPIGMELALCQRYYYRLTPSAVNKTLSTAPCIVASTVSANGSTQFPVSMRTTPATLDQSGTANQYSVLSVANTTCTAVPILNANLTTTEFGGVTFTTTGATAGVGTLRTDATNGATAFLGWSAEL
jgi:hypothetical protein